MALSETSATPDSPRLLEAVPAGRTCESLLSFLLPSNVVAAER